MGDREEVKPLFVLKFSFQNFNKIYFRIYFLKTFKATISTLIYNPSYVTIYISTEAPFPSERLQQMMRGQNDGSITDRILTESCDYLEAFLLLLDNRIQLIIDKVKLESKQGSANL